MDRDSSSEKANIERPKDFDSALERVDALCREVQVLCDEFGIDPYEYLADDEPSRSTNKQTEPHPSRWVWWEAGPDGGYRVGPADKGCIAIVFTLDEARELCRAHNDLLSSTAKGCGWPDCNCDSLSRANCLSAAGTRSATAQPTKKEGEST